MLSREWTVVMNTAEQVMQELHGLGLDDEPEPPPEADTDPVGTDDPRNPQDVPARTTDRDRAHRAAQGLAQTLKLLHQATGEALEASRRLCEALEASRPVLNEGEDDGEASVPQAS